MQVLQPDMGVLQVKKIVVKSITERCKSQGQSMKTLPPGRSKMGPSTGGEHGLGLDTKLEASLHIIHI
jgi:hypothetical protein